MKGWTARLLLSIALTIGSYLTAPHLAYAETIVRISSTYVNRGVDHATINWQTEPASKGQIEYAGPDGRWMQTPWTSDAREAHSVTIFNLAPNTTYLYKINAEDSNKKVHTKADTFTTLNGQIGSPMAESGSVAGFQSLLSPSPQPTQQQAQPPYYPSVLGQQVMPVMPMYTVPYPVAMQPAVTVVAPSPTPLPPTPTPEPTSTDLIAGFVSNNISNLGIGLVVGVTAAMILHLMTNRTRPIATSGYIKEATLQQEVSQQEPPKKKKRPVKKFHFSINT